MLCSAFHNIGKQFAKSDLKELKRILHKLDFKDMLEAETDSESKDQLVRSTVDAISEICASLSNDFDFVDRAEDISIERLVSRDWKYVLGIFDGNFDMFKFSKKRWRSEIYEKVVNRSYTILITNNKIF